VSSTGLPVDSQRLKNVDGRLEESGANYVDTWQSTVFVDGETPEWHELTYSDKRNEDFLRKNPHRAQDVGFFFFCNV
jgi:hypothetical protein